jgi:hypothetical protein
MRAALMGMVVATWACASAPPRKILPPVPGRGGPVWHELESEHFLLWTDLPTDEAKRTLRRLELFRGVMVAMVFANAEKATDKSLVFAFRHRQDWRLFQAVGGVAGFYFRSSRAVPELPLLAFTAEDTRETGYEEKKRGRFFHFEAGDDPAEIRQHELAHMVIHTINPDVPSWLDEGVASYFSTMRIDEKKRIAEVGRFPKTMGQRIRNSGMESVRSVVFVGDAEGDRGPRLMGFYLRSQVMVSYLLNHHDKLFSTYQRVLRQLPKEQRAEAWTRVFGHLPTLEDDMDAWMKNGKVTVVVMNLGQIAAEPLAMRPLRDAEVYYLRGLLYYIRGRDELLPLAHANVNAALDAEPGFQPARALDSALIRDPDEAALRAQCDLYRQTELSRWLCQR